MIEGINYETYMYKLSCEERTVRDARKVEKREPVTKLFKTEEELNAYKAQFKNTDSPNMKYYNEWCREWEEGKYKYLEYIMGFVADKQDDDFYERVIMRRKSSLSRSGESEQ